MIWWYSARKAALINQFRGSDFHNCFAPGQFAQGNERAACPYGSGFIGGEALLHKASIDSTDLVSPRLIIN